MKKLVNTIAIVITALALSVVFAACSGATFKVTASYDADQGTVTVTDADGDRAEQFRAGERAVISVTPATGYAVQSVTVGGTAVELTDGSYSFSVVADTAVSVVFKKTDEQGGGDEPGGDEPGEQKTPEQLFAEAYASVTDTFTAVGLYNYTVTGGETEVNNVMTVFGDGAVQITEESPETGEVFYNDVYVDIDGKLAQPYHTIDNEIAYLYPDEDIEYSEYGNPFKLIEANAFTQTDAEGVWALAQGEAADAAATAITGYNEGIESFTLTVSDGKISRIDIRTKLIERGSGDQAYSYVSEYRYVVSEWGVAEVEPGRIAPYAVTAESTALKAALEAAGRASNYTLHVHEEEAGYDDLDYDVYVTDTAIYDSCAGWESGYVYKSLTGDPEDALVYSFRIGDEDDGADKDGKLLIGDAVDYPTVRAMRATFGGFAPEIFKAENGAYILNDDCIEYTSDVLVNFADGADNIMLYRDYTLSVQITLRDGALYRVEMYYYVYGALVKRVLTYSAFDTTVMPLDFDDYIKESVLDDYDGTYTDGTMVVAIDAEEGTIAINGRAATVLGYSVQNEMFTVMYNNAECYILNLSEKQIILIIGDNSYTLTNTQIDPVDIPDEFGGVWADDDGNSVTVAYDKVMFGRNMLKVLSYSEDEGLIAIRGSTTYSFEIGQLSGETVLEVRAFSSNTLSTNTYILSKQNGALIVPEGFVGTYERYDVATLTDYRVVITLNGVVATINGTQTVATELAVVDDNARGTILTFKLDGADHEIALNYSNIVLYSDGNSVNLSRTEDDDPAHPPVVNDVEIPQEFYGSYMYHASGEFYYLSIDDTGIYAMVDMTNNEYTAEIIDYDEDYSMFVVQINGKTYYIIGMTEDGGLFVTLSFISDETGAGAVDVTLTRTDYESPDDPPAPTVDIPANFFGTYTGTSDDVTYTLTISSGGMTLKVGDAEPIKVIVLEYEQTDSGWLRFTVTTASAGFTNVSYKGDLAELGDSPVPSVFLSGNGTFRLNRVQE